MSDDTRTADSSVTTASHGPTRPARNHHSWSNPEQIRVRHLDLDLQVEVDAKVLIGTATLSLERVAAGAEVLRLDTRALRIDRVERSVDGCEWTETSFGVGPSDPILGAPLEIGLLQDTTHVRVWYATVPTATGLQWLEARQTAGKEHPFMFTQSQAIHARSWIPLQDTPGVRVTYAATVRTPPVLRAVMSARNDPDAAHTGVFRFEMPQPIPSYLIALAVGDLEFRAMSVRTGVYAESPVVDLAASEFEDTEAMIQTTERLYGPYRWGRYDLLVLPPSFPFGGIENPRLTFATPTVIAGDKSLVTLVAHELAHSWSGNLVTNATWRDLWLNEGFTVYLERRIIEAVFGRARADMEAMLDRTALDEELAGLEPSDQILHIDLAGRDPDDGLTQVPYLKGELFLRLLHDAVGRDRFDTFVRGYFSHFAFRSVTTDEFEHFLNEHLLSGDVELARSLQIDAWLREPGLPDNTPRVDSDALICVENAARDWSQGAVRTEELDPTGWTTQEWLHFLKSLPPSSKSRSTRRARPGVWSDAGRKRRGGPSVALHRHSEPIRAGLSTAGVLPGGDRSAQADQAALRSARSDCRRTGPRSPDLHACPTRVSPHRRLVDRLSAARRPHRPLLSRDA